jgi:hypothetical protein
VPTSLGSLKTQLLARADLEFDANISGVTGLLNGYVNASRQRLRRLLVSANPQLFVTSKAFTLTGTTFTYDLGANAPTFWKSLALDLVTGSQADQIERVKRFVFAERTMQVEWISFRIYGNTLEIRPASQAPGSYVLWYIEQPAVMADDVNDKLLLVEDMWSEFVVLDGAIKARKRQQKNAQDLVDELKELAMELRTGAADNDAGEPDRVLDVDSEASWRPPRLPPA